MKEYEEMTVGEFASDYGVPQRELAIILGMSQQSLSQYERTGKSDQVVRYNKKTGDIQYVRIERVIASGNHRIKIAETDK